MTAWELRIAHNVHEYQLEYAAYLFHHPIFKRQTEPCQSLFENVEKYRLVKKMFVNVYYKIGVADDEETVISFWKMILVAKWLFWIYDALL